MRVDQTAEKLGWLIEPKFYEGFQQELISITKEKVKLFFFLGVKVERLKIWQDMKRPVKRSLELDTQKIKLARLSLKW